MTAIRRLLSSVAAVALTAYLLLAGPAAFAIPFPPDPMPAAPQSPQVQPVTTHVVEVGSPIWMFVLVALVSAALTFGVDRLLVRSRQWSPSKHAHA